MGFLKWIKKREFERSHTNVRRRQSAPPMTSASGKTIPAPDAAYTEALTKFNEWRNGKQNQEAEKINHNHNEHKYRRKLYHSNNHNNSSSMNNSNFIQHNYEEIETNLSKNSLKIKIENRCSLPPIWKKNLKKTIITDDIKIYENEIYQFEQKNCKNINTSRNEVSSPPSKFYKENSLPFTNSESQSQILNDPQGLQFLKQPNKSRKNEQKNQSKKYQDNIIPIYQKVINKHGDLVEYALPFIEQIEIIKEGNLTESEMNVSQQNQLIVTDLDKSYGHVQSIINNEILKNKQYLVTLEENTNTNKMNSLKNDVRSAEKYDQKINSLQYNEHNSEIISCSISEIEILPIIPIKLYSTKFVNGIFRSANICQLKNECNDFNVNAMIITNLERLRLLRHPSISLLMGLTNDNGQLNSIFFESFSDSLHNEIHTKDNYISIPKILSYIIQLTSAVCYCHKNTIVHSNVCSNTIMISGYDKCIKLACFELSGTPYIDPNIFSSKQQNNHNILQSVLPYFIDHRKKFSAFYYQAPELISTKNNYVLPKFQSDIYGVCMTLWEMLNKSLPFQFMTYDGLEELFIRKKAQLPIYEEERCKIFKNILEKGLQIDVENRLNDCQKLLNLFENLNVKISKIKKNTLDKVSRESSRDLSNMSLNEKSNRKITVIEEENIEHIDECMQTELIAPSASTPNSTPKTTIKDNISSVGNNNDSLNTPIISNKVVKRGTWESVDVISPIQKLKYPNENIQNKLNVQSCNNELPELKNQGFSNISDHINYLNAMCSMTNENLPKRNYSSNISSSDTKVSKKSAEPNNVISKTSSDTSFEDVLWKHEKELCVKDKSEEPCSSFVKETVNKFESIALKYDANMFSAKRNISLINAENQNEKKSDKTLEENIEDTIDKNINKVSIENFQAIEPKTYASTLDIILDKKLCFDLNPKNTLLKLENLNTSTDIDDFVRRSGMMANIDNVRNSSICEPEYCATLRRIVPTASFGNSFCSNDEMDVDNTALIGKMTCLNCGCNAVILKKDANFRIYVNKNMNFPDK